MAQHETLLKWVEDVAALCSPERVHGCDGSDAEYRLMIRTMVQAGTAIPTTENLRPGSVLVRSNPADVARVEDRTFLCCEKKEHAGPTNNWCDPNEIRATLRDLFAGSMQSESCPGMCLPFYRQRN